MKIIEFSVKHSLFVNLLSALIIIAGVISMFQLRREAFPEVSFDIVTVETMYSGASAEEVEKLVTAPLEKELKNVDDVDELSSSSREGYSLIALELNPDLNENDVMKVVDDIQKAVDRVTDLPEGVEDKPLVTEITSNDMPAIKLALSGNLPEAQLRDLADKLEDRIENIEGVSSIRKTGWRDEEYWVEPDINKLKTFHVSIEEIMQALSKKNVTIPAGKLRLDGQEFIVKTTGEFVAKEDIENVIIRANDLGNWLRVKDLANVRHTFEEESIIHKTMGTRSITLIVLKREKGDAIKMVAQIKDEIKDFTKSVPKELKISTPYDLSYYIERRLNVLRNNGAIAIVLVVAVLFLFLHPMAALFTSLGIPIAMLATFWYMNSVGMSINMISMFGLIIVLGMVVDDGIIISENVYRYFENGMPAKEAAIKGANEVMAPVFATIMTTFAAFSPLLFMSGLIGKFVKQIPLVVIIALSASVIEAFVILPSHLADFVKANKDNKENRVSKIGKTIFNKVSRLYNKVLNKALNHRYKFAATILIIFITSMVYAKLFMPFLLFGSKGVEQFHIRAEAKPGTSLYRMEELLRPVEEFVGNMPREYLDSYETLIGSISEERGFDPNAKQASNVAQIEVYLSPAQGRRVSAKQIMDDMRGDLVKIKDKLPELEKLYFKEFKDGPPTGKAVDLRVRGEDFQILKTIAEEVKEYLSSLKGIKDIDDSYDTGKRELRVIIDEEKSTMAFLTVGEVATSLRNAFEGGMATEITRSKAEEKIKVLVRLPQKQRDTMDVFNNLVIVNKYGNLVPLKSIATIEDSWGLTSIEHYEGERIIGVSASVNNKQMTSKKANGLLKYKFKDISDRYPGYSIKYVGEEQDNVESMRSLVQAFAVAFLLIFLILATIFNSLIQPFVVMLTIPFGLVGVIFALSVHNEPVSFLAIMGIIGLAGVVVNDSIVFVDFINKLRKQGIDRRDSIVQAGLLRLRPVMLTTITTVFGLSTVAYGIGGSDPFLRPMALSISWGLLFGTVLTLVIMPCIYAIIDDITVKVVHHATVRKNNNNH